MSRDAFRRLALVAASSGWLVALAVVWRYLGPPAAVVAGLVGPVVAVVLTVEEQPRSAEPREELPEGLSRREILRRTRHAEPTD